MTEGTVDGLLEWRAMGRIRTKPEDQFREVFESEQKVAKDFRFGSDVDLGTSFDPG